MAQSLMSDSDPIMTPRSFGFFSEWYVQVDWPGGHKEKVQTFKSEADARRWIEHESQAWISKVRGPRR